MGNRRKKGRPISGWLVLDKDYDTGSTEAVSKAKWLFQAQKAGHAGTLDPLATGVLPIAFGEATKTVPYIMDAEKRYQFTAAWGKTTNTDDLEGDVIASSDVVPTRSEIESILNDFTGEIEQTPPQFSAIKINGARAYDIARGGEIVDMPSRIIDVHTLELVDIPDRNHAVFEATTGKGAYVRALVRDMAKALGTEGHISQLRRLSVGPFKADEGVTVEALEKYETPEDRDEALLGLDVALLSMPQTSVTGSNAEKLRRGQAAIVAPVDAKGIRGDTSGFVPEILASLHGDPVAICSLDGLKLKPVRVFNL